MYLKELFLTEGWWAWPQTDKEWNVVLTSLKNGLLVTPSDVKGDGSESGNPATDMHGQPISDYNYLDINFTYQQYLNGDDDADIIGDAADKLILLQGTKHNNQYFDLAPSIISIMLENHESGYAPLDDNVTLILKNILAWRKQINAKLKIVDIREV